jgi:hypothetical protein
MVYYDENKLNAMPEAEKKALYAEAYAHYDRLVKSGHALAGDPLDSVLTAKSVRAHQGGVTVTDGPYVETKEQLGGFILIEAEDLDEAIRIAAETPPVRLGGIEVRPVIEMRSELD